MKLCVDWSGMVYSPTGSSDLFWSSAAQPLTSCTWAFPRCILVFFFCGELIPSSFLHQISPLFSNKPPVSDKPPPPSNWFEMNKPYGGGGGGLTEDLHYAAVYVGMWLQVYWSGAHNPERATPILVLCHGIFTEHFIGFLDTFIQYWFQL